MSRSLSVATIALALVCLPLLAHAKNCFNDNDCNTFPCGVSKCANKKWWRLGRGTCVLQAHSAGTLCATFPDQLCAPQAFCDGSSGDCPAPAPVADGTVCVNSTDVCRSSSTCSAGICVSGAPRAVGAVCRPSVGACDVEELCTATGATENGVAVTQCSNDTVKAAGQLCATVPNACAPQAFCDGSSGVCPAPTRLPDGTSCAPATNPCRGDSTCFAGHCLAGAFLPEGTVCRPSRGPCDIEETCRDSGFGPLVGTLCPNDRLQPRSLVCRPANATPVNGQCDVAETCTGFNTQCPPDAWRAC